MNKFAFIIHPIEIQDFYKKFPILENTPDFMVKSIGKLLLPFKISEIKGISSSRGELQGYLIAIPLTLKQMLELPEEQIVKKIIKAGKLAQKLGADIIGMESYTSIIGNARASISENLSIPITTGRTYSISSAIGGIKKATEIMDKDFKECDLTIIGINEAIGSVIARYLAKEAKYLTLVSENRNLLEDLSQRILTETGTAIHITDNTQSAVKRGDIIVIAANTDDLDINIEIIKKGAIICDLSRPRIVTKELEKKRQDVFFIDGGIVKLPFNVDFGFDFGFSPNTCSAALGETILLSLEKNFECLSLGEDIEIEKIDSINKMAQDNNFNITGVKNYNKEIHISDF
jgi:predicted amino acid dehydrogenase